MDARYAFERATRFAEESEGNLENARASGKQIDLDVASAYAALSTAFGTIALASAKIWPENL